MKVGQTVEIKKRTFTVKEIEITADVYPNTKRNNPNIEFHVIFEGARGALKAGYITKNGTIVLF